MPDINSLTPSPSASGSPSQPRVPPNPTASSSRSSSISQAANNPSAVGSSAGPHSHESRRSSTSSNTRHRAGGVSPRAGRHERQRSGVGPNLNPSEAPPPASGELHASEHRPLVHGFRTSSPQTVSPLLATADPHHQRTPSLGELHQQLEQEQEAQVVSFGITTTIDAHTGCLKTGLMVGAESSAANDPAAAESASPAAARHRPDSIRFGRGHDG